jgi:hypothetical protein
MPTPPQLRRDLLSLRYAQQEYDREAAYYAGTQQELFASQRVQRILREINSSVYKLNSCSTAVDAFAERLEVLDIEATNPSSHETDEKADQYLDDVFEQSELALEFKELQRLTLLHGSAYLIAWPDDSLPCGVSAYTHPPTSVRGFYHPLRPRHMVRAIHVVILQAGDDEVGEDLGWMTEGRLYFQVTEYTERVVSTYVSRVPVDDGRGVLLPIDYETIDMELFNEVTNPYDTLPVIHFRVNRQNHGYGESLLQPAIGPQVCIDKILVGMMSSIDFAAYRQRYLLTEAGDPLGDNFSTPAPTDDSGVDGATSLDDYVAGAGSLWHFDGKNVKVGEFNTAEIGKSFLEPIQSLLDWAARVCDIPSHYWNIGGRMPSGISLRQAEIPLIKKCSSLQANLTSSYRKLAKFFLQVGGFVPDAVDLDVTWAPLQVEDSLEFWQAAQIKADLGVPPAEIFKQSGVLDATAEEWAAQGKPTQQGSGASPIIDGLATAMLNSASKRQQQASAGASHGATPPNAPPQVPK